MLIISWLSCILLNNYLSSSLPVFLSEGSFFLVKQVHQVTGDPRFVTGETFHRSGGYRIIHTEVYIVGHILSHGIDLLSMWLAQCVPVCSLKATSHRLLQLPVTIFSEFSLLQVASEQGAYIWIREKQDCDLICLEEVFL
ncbi:hypothetical protein CHARACLAT_028396 [Characodon lateralis]|uniref:Uncharacterized protein n=1 Tax=Characodon lateralis TaxID=208331 RepID=A0ABU7EN90_9TELE|nr:hypothetical protein [Characodon lateralis]